MGFGDAIAGSLGMIALALACIMLGLRKRESLPDIGELEEQVRREEQRRVEEYRDSRRNTRSQLES